MHARDSLQLHLLEEREFELAPLRLLHGRNWFGLLVVGLFVLQSQVKQLELEQHLLVFVQPEQQSVLGHLPRPVTFVLQGQKFVHGYLPRPVTFVLQGLEFVHG